MQSPTKPIVVLVRLSPGSPFEVIDTSGPRVGHIKNALIAEFKQLEGMKADEIKLFKLDGNIRTLLDPAQTLHGAGVEADTELEVERTAAAPAFNGTRGTCAE